MTFCNSNSRFANQLHRDRLKQLGARMEGGRIRSEGGVVDSSRPVQTVEGRQTTYEGTRHLHRYVGWLPRLLGRKPGAVSVEATSKMNKVLSSARRLRKLMEVQVRQLEEGGLRDGVSLEAAFRSYRSLADSMDEKVRGCADPAVALELDKVRREIGYLSLRHISLSRIAKRELLAAKSDPSAVGPSRDSIQRRVWALKLAHRVAEDVLGQMSSSFPSSRSEPGANALLLAQTWIEALPLEGTVGTDVVTTLAREIESLMRDGMTKSEVGRYLGFLRLSFLRFVKDDDFPVDADLRQDFDAMLHPQYQTGVSKLESFLHTCRSFLAHREVRLTGGHPLVANDRGCLPRRVILARY